MATKQMQIEGMTCVDCEKTIAEALTSVGASKVVANWDEELTSSCENVYEDWCPNSNLFANKELATRWAEQHSLPGSVLDLGEASDLATNAWSDVI